MSLSQSQFQLLLNSLPSWILGIEQLIEILIVIFMLHMAKLVRNHIINAVLRGVNKKWIENNAPSPGIAAPALLHFLYF